MLKILTLCSALALALSQQPPTVELDGQGTVIGTQASDGNYFEFHGIPYADATSGINRFKAPLPPPSFQTPLTANRKNIKCVRALGAGYEGTEDCLVANIYTPSLDNTKKLPVMVWIKGKEFDQIINPELSFRNFVLRDVVVVSLNYRESILGFLCLGTETAPGNAGLKDIIAGLKWIQKNIAQFGGDPESITIVGHGSGGAAVDLVTMSPMSKGLVHKAIAQSGNAYSPWAVSRDNLKHALDVAEALGHTITTIEQLSEVFTRTSVGALMGVINDLDLTDNSLAFAPCVEREELNGVEPFLIKTPAQIVNDGEFLNIPTIIGYVDYEGTIRSKEAIDNDWLNRMTESFSDFIQPDLEINDDEVNQIKTYYFGPDKTDLYEQYLEYHGDTMILISSAREVRNRAFATTSQNTYLYQFSYKGTLGDAFVGPIKVDYAPHGAELAYLFLGSSEANDLDIRISNILVDRWTNFAKTGNPITEHSNVVWRPYTRTVPNFLRIGSAEEITGRLRSDTTPVEIGLTNPHPATVSFWEHIYTSHFLDAQSNWEITDRNEDPTTTTTTPTTTTTTLSPGGIDECDGDGDDCGNGNNDCEGEDCKDDNSATTAVGYTFLIISLFSVLNHFHSSQILS